MQKDKDRAMGPHSGDDHVGSEEQKQPSFLLALRILVFKGMQILS